MRKSRILFLGLTLISVCFLSACRTTEGQIYYSGPIQVKPYAPYAALTPETEAPATPPAAVGTKVPFLLLTIIILITLIMIFAADGKPKRRRTTSKPKKKRKRTPKKALSSAE